jgi:CheY-like chemotaxis protein
MDDKDWSRAGLSRGVVLHVEDDDDARGATGVLLSAAGFEFRGAGGPEEAFAQAETLRERLDVLIVDYHLGAALTGTEVAEAIARKLGHGIPIIMLTGDPANADAPWLGNSPVWLARKPVCPVTLIAGLWPLVAFRRAMKKVPRR